MKTLITTVALASLVAITGCYQHLPLSSLSPPQQTALPSQVVTHAGQVVGQDPDIHIRAQLTRDAECYIGNCGGD